MDWEGRRLLLRALRTYRSSILPFGTREAARVPVFARHAIKVTGTLNDMGGMRDWNIKKRCC